MHWQATIILTRANLPEAVPYYCMRCRNRLFDINREIVMLYPGMVGYPGMEIPRQMGQLKHKCRGCQSVYNFYFQ